MNPEWAAALAVFVPLLGSIGIGLLDKYPNPREAVTLSLAAALLLLVISLVPYVTAGFQPRVQLLEVMPGLALALEVEPLGLLFALIASGLWIVTSVYSIGYMRGNQESHQTRYYICFAIALSATMGVAFAANMFTLFVFYEVLTLSTYPLVAHKGTEEAKRGGRVYLILLLSTSIGFLLLAMVWTWYAAGTLDFVNGGILRDKVDPGLLPLLLALYMFGIGKAALMPFHRWLPAAMVAPTPVSALLHAVAVVKAGVFTVVKVTIYVFGIDLLRDTNATTFMMWIAAITLLAASLVAMTKDNLKARLAYSTISQLAYVTLGAMLVNTTALIGAGMHIATHAFGKITLFFCAGAIYVTTHKTEISEMNGLGRVMPITYGAMLIGALSIIGLPPLGGTWSKWYLAIGTLEADQWVMLIVLLVSSLLNVAYLLPIPIRGFFGRPSIQINTPAIKEAPLPVVIALVFTATGCLFLFFFPEPLYGLMALLF
jgi:multicomponent Na+:H+ antiporter subunit D